MRQKARHSLDQVAREVMNLIKEEVVEMLDQQAELRRQLESVERTLSKSLEKIKDQELALCKYKVRFHQKALKIDITDDEVEKIVQRWGKEEIPTRNVQERVETHL